MENKHPLPDKDAADLDIINALKAMKQKQKKDILNKIAELSNEQSKSKISLSSAANKRIY